MPTNEHHNPALLAAEAQKPARVASPPVAAQPAAGRPTHHVRRPNWTTAEDEQLCRSWLENAVDPVTNTIQKGSQFWNRVADDFAAQGPGLIERNKDHVRNRWQLLQAKVIKFTSCYERIQGLIGSAQSDEEMVSEAMRLYEREEQHKFTFYSSWQLLRRSSRWQKWTFGAGGGSQPGNVRRTSVGEGGTAGSPGSMPGSPDPLLHRLRHRTTSTGRRKSEPHQGQQEQPHGHHDEGDRLLAMAIKRKADVHQEALEVQLLAIDPASILDPLRREVYRLKMEHIRDRYRAKRPRAASFNLLSEQHSPDDLIDHDCRNALDCGGASRQGPSRSHSSGRTLNRAQQSPSMPQEAATQKTQHWLYSLLEPLLSGH
ncbi:hypothetical protein PtB15_13B371 [Puccinia triticina]|nr:hypothetical protein PtB15_13B371 [Puccinia triticina]